MIISSRIQTPSLFLLWPPWWPDIWPLWWPDIWPCTLVSQYLDESGCEAGGVSRKPLPRQASRQHLHCASKRRDCHDSIPQGGFSLAVPPPPKNAPGSPMPSDAREGSLGELMVLVVELKYHITWFCGHSERAGQLSGPNSCIILFAIVLLLDLKKAGQEWVMKWM